MLELAPLVIAAQALTPRLLQVTLGAPALAGAAQPGQFAAVRLAEPGSYDPIHRMAVPIAGIDRTANTVTLLWATDSQMLGPTGVRVGDALNVLGPLGHGWMIAPSVRNLLLVGTVTAVGSLLALAEAALRQQHAVTLVLGGEIGPSLPAHVMPAAVEYHLGRGLDPVVAALDLLNDDLLRWADAIYTTLPAVAWTSLANRLERTRMRWERGFAQAATSLTFPCSVGVCGVCVLTVGRKVKLACLDGPIFDLRDLMRA